VQADETESTRETATHSARQHGRGKYAKASDARKRRVRGPCERAALGAITFNTALRVRRLRVPGIAFLRRGLTVNSTMTEGTSDNVARIVTGNARALQFATRGLVNE
jgi:hypothetical protein